MARSRSAPSLYQLIKTEEDARIALEIVREYSRSVSKDATFSSVTRSRRSASKRSRTARSNRDRRDSQVGLRGCITRIFGFSAFTKQRSR